MHADKVHFSMAFTTFDSWCGALGLLRGMSSSQMEGDVVSYGSAISACQSNWIRSIQLQYMIVSMAVLPNPVLCSSAIDACRNWRRASFMLLDMAQRQVASQALCATVR